MPIHFQNLLASDLKSYDQKFQSLIDGDFSLIKPIREQIFKSKGKQLRPILVILTHKLFSPTVSEQAYLAASLIEIIHAASLVHDDVVDMADMRRGEASARALFGNKSAVLAGDYLLSNAFLKAYDQSDNQLLLFLVDVIRMMSEGELIQLEYANNSHANQEIYFHVLERKTAALFACCCRCGAYTAGADENEIRTAMEMGKMAGIAFQIKDDLLDLNKEKDSGKHYGNDLKEGKMTLPTLYYLERCLPSERKSFMSQLKELNMAHENHMEGDEALLETLVTKVKSAGGEEYARNKALEYMQGAMEAYYKLNRKSDLMEALIRFICTGE